MTRFNPVRWWGKLTVPVLLLYTLCHMPVGVQALSTLTTGSAQTDIPATVPLVVQVGDRQHALQVPPGTVADALAWSRIAVGPLDLVAPGLETPVDAGMHIRIVIRERNVSETLAPVPYEVVWEGDPTLPIDHQALRAPGRAGSMVQRNLHEHHDGQAMTNLQRTESWLAEAPQAKADCLRPGACPPGIRIACRRFRGLLAENAHVDHELQSRAGRNAHRCPLVWLHLFRRTHA